MTEPTDMPESYYAILDAAIEEFASKGYAGVRLEQVARTAGYNKSLVYRFFKNREILFQEALKRQFGKRRSYLESLPEGVVETLSWWSKQNQQDPLFVRLILRESLDGDSSHPVEAEARRQYYQQQIAMLRSLQQQGLLPESLEPDFLFLALLAVTFVPASMPQICALVTGDLPGTQDFEEGWERFLSGLADTLKQG